MGLFTIDYLSLLWVRACIWEIAEEHLMYSKSLVFLPCDTLVRKGDFYTMNPLLREPNTHKALLTEWPSLRRNLLLFYNPLEHSKKNSLTYPPLPLKGSNVGVRKRLWGGISRNIRKEPSIPGNTLTSTLHVLSPFMFALHFSANYSSSCHLLNS